MLNISQSGFLVELATVPVLPGNKVTVSLSCFPPFKKEETLNLEAEVVRVDFDQFAGNFTDINHSHASFMVKHLSAAARGYGL